MLEMERENVPSKAKGVKVYLVPNLDLPDAPDPAPDGVDT